MGKKKINPKQRACFSFFTNNFLLESLENNCPSCLLTEFAKVIPGFVSLTWQATKNYDVGCAYLLQCPEQLFTNKKTGKKQSKQNRQKKSHHDHMSKLPTPKKTTNTSKNILKSAFPYMW